MSTEKIRLKEHPIDAYARKFVNHGTCAPRNLELRVQLHGWNVPAVIDFGYVQDRTSAYVLAVRLDRYPGAPPGWWEDGAEEMQRNRSAKVALSGESFDAAELAECLRTGLREIALRMEHPAGSQLMAFVATTPPLGGEIPDGFAIGNALEAP